MEAPVQIPRRVIPLVMVVLALVIGVIGVRPVEADRLSDLQAEARRVADELERLDRRAMEINAEYERVNFELREANRRIAEAEVWAAGANEELERSREQVKRMAVEAYQSGLDSPEFDAILTNDPETGVKKREYLQNLGGARIDAIDSLNAAKVRVAEDMERLDAARAEAKAKSDAIEGMRAEANAAAAQQRAVNSRVQGELAALVNAERAATANRNAGGGFVANPPPPGSAAAVAIAAGRSKIGSGYSWGASGPDVFDCSGFTLWAYAQAGVSLPHYSGAQYRVTLRISRDQLQPGDLVFWGSGGSEHVAIYIGGNQLLHTANGVNITQLDGWWKTPSGYGRIPS